MTPRAAAVGLTLAAWALALGAAACRRGAEPSSLPASAPAPPARPPASSAHPAEFVHPPVPSDPPPIARPECSAQALDTVAGRIHDIQAKAASAAEPRGKHNRAAPACGSPAMDQIYREVNGALLDRVRICVGQDGPLDAEWNLLDSALASLAACADCRHAAGDRAQDCRRALASIARAQHDTRTKPAPAP